MKNAECACRGPEGLIWGKRLPQRLRRRQVSLNRAFFRQQPGDQVFRTIRHNIALCKTKCGEAEYAPLLRPGPPGSQVQIGEMCFTQRREGVRLVMMKREWSPYVRPLFTYLPDWQDRQICVIPC